MTIGDCSCYWDIKQTYFVWSLSAQILYSFIWVRRLQKKKENKNSLEHLGPLFKPWNPSYRIMTQVRLTEGIGVSSSSISVGWQTIQSSCHLPTRQYNRANIALLTSTIDTLPDRKKIWEKIKFPQNCQVTNNIFKGNKYIEKIGQIHVTTLGNLYIPILTNPWGKFDKSL